MSFRYWLKINSAEVEKISVPLSQMGKNAIWTSENLILYTCNVQKNSWYQYSDEVIKSFVSTTAVHNDLGASNVISDHIIYGWPKGNADHLAILHGWSFGQPRIFDFGQHCRSALIEMPPEEFAVSHEIIPPIHKVAQNRSAPVNFLVPGTFNRAIVESMTKIVKKGHTVETLYNTINFCWSTHKRHSIARPKGRGMGCLLWVQRATYCVDLSIWSSIKYLLW